MVGGGGSAAAVVSGAAAGAGAGVVCTLGIATGSLPWLKHLGRPLLCRFLENQRDTFEQVGTQSH